VGRASFDWVDPNRAELYSANPQDRRELVVWVWYPAAPSPGAERAAYLPEAWAPAGQLLGLDAAGLRSHAMEHAAVADEQASYPVLVLSPSGFPPLLLAAIAEELASHGYVVAGVNHTYETAVTVFADGRVVPMTPAAVAGLLGPQTETGPYQERFAQRAAVCDYKAADLASVADQLQQLPADAAGLLAGRLDLDRLGGFGHSFGGNAALQWCRNDRRCRAAANLDGALWTEVGRAGLDRPVLKVLAEHPDFALSGEEAVQAGMATDAAAYDTEKAISLGGWRTVHQRGRPGYTLQVKGAGHLSFLDVGLLPSQGEGPVKAMLAATSIEPQRMWRTTCDLLLAFFATHLGEAATQPLLEEPSGDYPELAFGPP
jgi:dienelactone hydrolase